MDKESDTNKVHNLSVDRRLLEYIDRMTNIRLKFDERSLTIEKDRGLKSESFVHDLWRLQPKISIGKASNEYAIANLQSGGVIFLSGIIVYFSEFNPMIPLLAPALGILGFIRLLSVFLSWNRGVHSRIYSDYGDLLLSIPHRGIDKSEREAFEKTLIACIKEARNRSYGDSEI
ncbi:MAG TPA: hypothetical protein ENG78_02615 [Acidiferrobacteraceae bacterium]|nr:hypothetical protein [Acidiferrobacteraceae bacterium]HEX19701.1 hypothetical protein [Acidiferrobacteraceae bacterium]